VVSQRDLTPNNKGVRDPLSDWLPGVDIRQFRVQDKVRWRDRYQILFVQLTNVTTL
jgi:hypothetical protein